MESKLTYKDTVIFAYDEQLECTQAIMITITITNKECSQSGIKTLTKFHFSIVLSHTSTPLDLQTPLIVPSTRIETHIITPELRHTDQKFQTIV